MGRSEDSTAEAHAVAALKGSGFSGLKLRVLILVVHVLQVCSLELGGRGDLISKPRILHAAKGGDGEETEQRPDQPFKKEKEGRRRKQLHVLLI